MLITLDFGRIEENCEAVAKHSANKHGSLKVRFAEGLQNLMNYQLPYESKRSALTFCRKETCEFLVKKGVVPAAEMKALKKLPVERINRLRNDIAAGRAFLACANPRIVELLDLVVAEIAVIQVAKPEAGSHSSAISMIWMNPDESWSSKYFAEIIFHELLHQIFFLEDMVRGIMPDVELLEREETRAFSAVRKTARYFDSAMHAAFVTIGMMYFYDVSSKLVRGGNTARIAECMTLGRKAVSDLKRVASNQEALRRPILSENGTELLAGMAAFFETPDFESIDSMLSV